MGRTGLIIGGVSLFMFSFSCIYYVVIVCLKVYLHVFYSRVVCSTRLFYGLFIYMYGIPIYPRGPQRAPGLRSLLLMLDVRRGFNTKENCFVLSHIFLYLSGLLRI